MDEADLDLVEYVIGLLDHPEFSQPDIMVAELHEFMGQKTQVGLCKK